MVELQDVGDLVGVLARSHAEHAERGRDTVGAAFDGELDDVLRVEVDRVRREGRRGRVLDALVHGKDGHVPGSAEAAVIVERLQALEHGGGAIGEGEEALDGVGAGDVDRFFGDADAFMLEELGVGSEQGFDVRGHVGESPMVRKSGLLYEMVLCGYLILGKKAVR